MDKFDRELAEDCARFYVDPVGFARWAFDWGKGALYNFSGLDTWQEAFLRDLGEHIAERGFDGHEPVLPTQMAVASGHGIGKSALTAITVLWLMSTRPYCRGTVTANTGDQLRTKTWGELSKWKQLCITGHWFDYSNSKGNMNLAHKSFPNNWRVDAVTCREENSEAFAGQHNASSTSFYLFDEACHDDQTEVMTSEGWQWFKDVTPDTCLLTMDPDDGVAYYDFPTHLHVHDYEGPLLVSENKGANFAVTPNHRILSYSRKRPDKPRLEEAGSMVWSDKLISRVVYQQGHYDPELRNHVDVGERIPRWVFEESTSTIRGFLGATVFGDQQVLHTSSEELADDYQELALRAGVKATILPDGLSVDISNGRSYTVEPETRFYKGKVYCATVSGSVLYTRRGKEPMWSGNSNVPDQLWDVALGGLTDGEPVFLAFGNPTRNTGYFRNLFKNDGWDTRQIDSRQAARTNKGLIDQWIEERGENSDFVRVRVKGQFPMASDFQFFPGDVVNEAMKRSIPQHLGDEPLIAGVDLSRGGSDSSIIQFRRGRDARSEKRYRIPGEKTRDSMQVSTLIASVLDLHHPDTTFLDVGSMGGPIGDRLRQLGYHVIDVGFGHKPQDERLFSNRVSEMASRCLEWLNQGGCLPFVYELEQDLTSREFMHDNKDRLFLEKKSKMKSRLGRSPDDSDALFLTFASKVAERPVPRDDRAVGARGSSREAYHPLDRWDQ